MKLFVLIYGCILVDYGSGNLEPVTVVTDEGKLRGSVKKVYLYKNGKRREAANVVQFLGVPFAEPPVGDLRFQPPQKLKKWTGTKQAFVHSAACPQPRDEQYPTFWGAEMWNYKNKPDEDCLKLNMWYPVGIKNATVLVWIFGGGFTAGSPSLDVYNGEGLAIRGNVIVINLNYRLGPFGFLYLDDPKVPGNMGMLDQQAALEWVRRNIHHFGGNPNKVTLFGESAGAASIVGHMIAYRSRNLFNNGILQSGSVQNPWAMDKPERALNKSLKLSQLLGCGDKISDKQEIISCLRSASMDTIIEKTWNVVRYFMEFPNVMVSRDQNFFRDMDAFDAVRNGNYKATDVIVGLNQDEGTFWMNYLMQAFGGLESTGLIDRRQFDVYARQALNRETEVFQNAAIYQYSDNLCKVTQPKSLVYMNSINQLVGDYQFTCDAFWLADQITNTGRAKAYIYHYTQRLSSVPWPKWMGVIHGYEIELIFGIPLINRTHTLAAIQKKNDFLVNK